MIIRYVLAFVVLSIIIIFHELGHFWLAKKNGIRVNEFSLGLGPTIVGFQHGETKFSIKALPFGGACMMEGEDGESNDDRSFQKKPVWARISVVAAGPIFNFILAFVFSVIIIGSVGVVKPVLSDVSPGYAAQEAGLQAGDEIIKMGNKHIFFYNEVSMYSIFHAGETTEVTYKRDGETKTAVLKPIYNEEEGRYLYGFIGAAEQVRVGPVKTIGYSALNVKFWIQYTYGSLKMLLTNQVSMNEMSGPVGIVKYMGDSYAESRSAGIFYGFLTLLNFGILISANLGVINLLPLPALDGGRLVFLIIEAIRGKRVIPEREGMVHFVGIVCLFALMIFIMFNDVRNLFI